MRCRLGLPEIQSTHLTSSFTTFDECRECGAAFSHALRGHTHSTQPGAAAQGPQASQFLDGAELRAWLGHYHAPSGSASSGRNWRGRANVLTVYLFDLARDEPLLLDGESQVVAFEDMVIAVQSNTARQPADYECDDEDDGTGRGDEGGEGEGGMVAGVVSALLQTGWGVPPTHLSFSALHNRSHTDLLWSLSGTPSSPFASSTAAARLTWPEVDASQRSLLLSLLTARLTELRKAIAPLQRTDFDLDLGRVLTKAETVHFSKRWQLLNHKLGPPRPFHSQRSAVTAQVTRDDLTLAVCGRSLLNRDVPPQFRAQATDPSFN